MRTSVLIIGFSLALAACTSNSVKPTAATAESAESEMSATSLINALREPASAGSGLILNCDGTQDNKGAKGMIMIKGPAKNYAFSASRIQDGKAVAQIMCTGRKDTEYKATSNNPHFDRYKVTRDRACGFDDAFVARTIVEERAGSFSLLGECGNDFCTATYYCHERK